MPQFDIFLYFTYFFTFITYFIIFYYLITLLILPSFWNIVYFRYIKKETNKFVMQISNKYFKYSIFKLENLFYYFLNSIKLKVLSFYKNFDLFILNIFLFKVFKFLVKIVINKV